MKKDFTMLKDKIAFTAFSNCGHCTREQLLNNIKGMSNKRIDGYIKAGYIAKSICNKKNENIIAYKLTDSGRNYIKNAHQITHNYVPQNPYHDKALSEKYFSLSDSERASWKNETVLKNELKDFLEENRYNIFVFKSAYSEEEERYSGDELQQRYDEGEISVVDCSYTSDEGIIVSYEIETNHYHQAEIKAKIEYCSITNTEYTSTRLK